MTDIRAVVFDMDGVLIDAREWHFDTLNRALALVGHHISRTEHLAAYDGLPTSRKLEMLSRERGLPRSLHPFLAGMKQQYTMEMVAVRCRPVFQHQYALAALKADGYHLAVASNSIRSTVETMMQRSSLLPYLELLLSNEDVAAAKPDPEIYRLAMRRLGVRPDETLVVEDSEHGIRAARAAGAHVLVVHSPADVHVTALRAALRSPVALAA